MKEILLILLFAVAVAACGGAQSVPDDHITEITEQIQPVVDRWRYICQTGRQCLEAGGQDTEEFVKACEDGWRIFQMIETYQQIYCTAKGIECSAISSQ